MCISGSGCRIIRAQSSGAFRFRVSGSNLSLHFHDMLSGVMHGIIFAPIPRQTSETLYRTECRGLRKFSKDQMECMLSI